MKKLLHPYIYTTSWENHCPYSDLMKTNLPIASDLKNIILRWYTIRIKFIDGYLTSYFINGMYLIDRPGKFEECRIAEGVRLIEGTPLRYGGTNRHPYPTFKEGYCILEVDTFGLPEVSLNHIEIISITPL